MPRGGARIGAGRKPGSGSKAVAAPKLPKLLKPPKSHAAMPAKAETVAMMLLEPPEKPSETPGEPLTALALFQQVYRDDRLDIRTRLGAAAQALPFESARPAVMGKKETKNELAKKAAGRFAPSAPPKLVAAAGKQV